MFQNLHVPGKNLCVKFVWNLILYTGCPQKKVLIEKIVTKIECCGPNFPSVMSWERLILPSFSTRKKTFSRPKECLLLVIEPVHHGFSSYMKWILHLDPSQKSHCMVPLSSYRCWPLGSLWKMP